MNVRVLVVDDSPMDRHLAGSLIRRRDGFVASFANNGREALESAKMDPPDVVLTDLHMPEMDGLALVEAIRREAPRMPVILMTAHGSEEVAVRALQRGAASYVPKRNLASDLIATIESVLDVVRADRSQQKFLQSLDHVESQWVLDNDLSALLPLVGYLESNLSRMNLCDETSMIQVGVALREAIMNAIYHGNLELSSELLEIEGTQFDNAVTERRQTEPYCKRRVTVVAKETKESAVYIVRDEGPGFDTSHVADPMDPANLEKASGRGLLLIRTFMDEVTYNDRGNEITMVKYADRVRMKS